MAAILRHTSGIVYVRSISGILTFTSTGSIQNADGTAAAPSYTFASSGNTNTGMYLSASDTLSWSIDGTAALTLAGPADLRLPSTGSFGFTSGASTASLDTILTRDAANVLAQRNGTTAQKFNIYNTYTSSTNFESGVLWWFSNELYLGTDKGSGGGSARNLKFYVGGTSRWLIDGTTGHFLAVADNTYDIGASGATRPRNIYVAGDVIAGAGFTATEDITAGAARRLAFTGRSRWMSPANGTLQALNAAETGFTNILYGASGGATSRDVVQKKVTSIADNTATAVFTVTVPNANHAATIRLQFLSSNGSTDAFESSRCASGHVVVTRTTGANAVATAAAIDDAAIATVAAGATHTLAYGVSAISGAAGAANTFDITVTIDDSGNLGSNQVVAVAELLNAEATGITIA